MSNLGQENNELDNYFERQQRKRDASEIQLE